MTAYFCMLNSSELETKSNPTLDYTHTHIIPARVYNTQEYVVTLMSKCNLIWHSFRCCLTSLFNVNTNYHIDLVTYVQRVYLRTEDK